MSDDERTLLAGLRRHLDAAVHDLDGATVTRLRAARREALRGADRARRPAWLWPLASALSTGIVVAVAAALWLSAGPARAPLPGAGIEDLEVIASFDQVDLYTDTDFYRWLAEQNNAV
jgi:hypothetical protein